MHPSDWCSLYSFACISGVPGKPQISGFSSPVMEGDLMQLTCKTSGSKPAADIRWFKNDKEIKGKKLGKFPKLMLMCWK